MNRFLLRFYNCRIMKSAKDRRSMTNSRSNSHPEDTNRTDVKQAVTLMWISVLYVVCQSPKIIPDFYEALYCEYSKVINLKQIIGSLRFTILIF